MINHCDYLTLIHFLHVSKIFLSNSIYLTNHILIERAVANDLLQYLNLIFFTSFLFLKWFAGGGHSLEIDIVVVNISNLFMHLVKPQISSPSSSSCPWDLSRISHVHRYRYRLVRQLLVRHVVRIRRRCWCTLYY